MTPPPTHIAIDLFMMVIQDVQSAKVQICKFYPRTFMKSILQSFRICILKCPLKKLSI